MEKSLEKWWERGARAPAWMRYLLAFAAIAGCTLVRLRLDPWLGGGSQFIIFYAGIVAVAYLTGTGPAIFAVLMSALLADFYFLEPRGEFVLNRPAWIAESLFLLVCCIIVGTIHSLRMAQARVRKEAARNANILSSITDALVTLDREWRFSYISPQAAKMFQLMDKNPGSMLGRNHWEEFPNLVGSIVEKEYQRAAREQVRVEFEAFEPASRLWFDVNAYPSEEGLSVFFHDITERKKNEEWRRVSEERYKSLFESIDEGFCLIEMLFDEKNVPVDYRFLELNPAFEKQSGLKNAVGRTMKELVPMHEKHWFEIYGRVALTGESIRFENRAAGLDRWFDVYAYRPGPAENRTVAVLFNDISKRKKAEKDLQRAQKELQEHAASLENTVAQRTFQLQEKIDELETFSYSLSHDMRAPLRAIQHFNHIVLEEMGENIGDEGKDYLRKAINSAERMDRLIEDVLAFGQLSRQNMQLEVVNVEKLLREIIHERPEFREPKAIVTIQSPLIPVLGHDASLTQCITNLLSNAVKFVSPEVKPMVRIWSEPRNGQVRLWVEDNGIGMEKELHQKLFQMFNRLHSVGTYEGTGIGLAIVRKAAERMGGTTGLESEPGKGSRFWVQLRRGDQMVRDRENGLVLDEK